MVTLPAERTLMVWFGAVPTTWAIKLSELVKLTGSPELATAKREKSKSPTDLSGIGLKEMV